VLPRLTEAGHLQKALIGAYFIIANRSQQADHIRGIVAATMAHLAADATPATGDSAAQWQKWALGLSDDLVPAVNP
jgi:hypothetical protein